MRYQKFLLPAVLLTATTVTVFAFKLSPTSPGTSSAGVSTQAMRAIAAQPVADKAQPVTEEYVQRGALESRLRSAFVVLGDRLERPGKERLSMTGTLRRGGESGGATFVLLREFHGRLRLDEQSGTNHRVVVYKGNAAERMARPQGDVDDIETLAFDTAEHFFTALARGAAMRHLGDNFRSGDASGDSPSYNLYEITEDVETGTDKRTQTKVYGLNSNTLLLEMVDYETERDGSPLKVEVRLSDWRRVAGQMVPHHVERLENGRVTLSLDILTVTVSPRVDDRAFDAATVK